MKRLFVLFVLLFTVLFSYTVVAQELGSLKKGVEISFPEKIQKLFLDPLPAGTYSIGTGGYFTTIQSAFDKLSTDGIAGEVILELTDNLYTAPTDSFGFFLNGPIPGAGSNSRVTIKPAANKNVTIEGDGLATVTFLNTNYVTVDGVGLTGTTTLTIHTLHNAAFLYNDGIDFLNNSDHNAIQNIIIINEDVTRGSGTGFWTGLTGSAAPDSNLIQNNFVKQAGIGLYASGYLASVRAVGNIIRGNKIGSETDSLIAWGIQIEQSQNGLVENNVVQNLRLTVLPNNASPGINSYYGSGDIIRNNIVHNIKTSLAYSSIGILLSGWGSNYGESNLVYNNMVYDIQSTSTNFDNRVTGIQMWFQNNPKIYYNSVYLSGTGANVRGSAALFIDINCTNIDAKNNILVNTRDESPYCASAIYDFSASNLISNYNDLYYEPSQYNCMVSTPVTNYLSLEDWQATGKDLNSITEMPNFVEPFLHIDPAIPTNIESHATTLVGITTDFDGDSRNATTPDIGADEFQGTVGITWTAQTLPETDLMIQVKAVDLSVAWALGLHGGVFRTVDGGVTWTSVGNSLPVGQGITACIDAISATTAFVGGLNYDPTIVPPPPNDTTFIWRTTDGGDTWSVVFAQLHGWLNAVRMISATEGFGVGDPVDGKWTIVRTTNSGATWARIATEPAQLYNEVGFFRSLWTYGTKYIWFGTGLGNTNFAGVYRSTDAGLTWNRSDTPLQYVYSVCFTDSLYGVCGDTSLARSTDGGVTWSPLADVPSGHWYDDLFPTVSVSAGNDLWAVVDNVVYRSTDSGDSWYICYTGIVDTLTYASFVTVGDYTGGWVTSVGEKIVACNFYDPTTDIREIENGEIPNDFDLYQNYPNPFNPSTSIQYAISSRQFVSLKVYDILGNEIEILANEEQPAGIYEITWNAVNLPSGVYFYQLKAGNFIETKKMLLLK